MAAAAAELVVAWKEWGLRALVLLSLTVQATLLILAEFRRHIDSGVLKALAWSAYMLADATAIYVLGHLSVTSSSRSPEQGLVALWAPFLLLHLGGQDKITAYAIEDNQLWLRHLQTLVVQVTAAAYVIYGSPVVVGDRRSPLLLSATILMFLVGVVRYGERVWSLKCAGSSPTGNYSSDIGKRRFSLAVPESLVNRLEPAEASLLNAHMLLDLAKDRFKGPLPRLFLCGPSNPGSQLLGEEELYKVAEMQLSLLHDIFYTKAEATHTWYGLCIRVLSTLATIAAFLLFNMLLLGTRHPKLKGYRREDVAVTYVLFVGAVVLETTSLLRAMLSSWTFALLVKYGSEGSELCNSLAHVPLCLRRLVRAAEWRRKRSWKRSMGQHNLIQLCVQSRAGRWRKIARWMGVEDWWNTVAYSSPSIPISACTKELLMKSMKARQWGPEEFERRGLYQDLSWVADSKLEERILIWHIATEVYLCWYNKDRQDQQAGDDDGAANLVEVAQALSNYMLFLLASRPHMLPPDAGRNDYLVLCYALTKHMRYNAAEDLLSQLQRYADALWANNSPLDYELTCKNTNKRGDKMLKGGCSLAAFLIHQRDSSPLGATGTLEMVCRVWAQMLCFAAEECSANSHAKQLSSGGELLTVAAVAAKYMRSRRLSAHFHIESKRRSEW
ncbi:hypothetical protein HU200_057081 [Digitaria exilis]|uniref:DUF4220 domain-containing protein n=1 Tax=Digitaria exilis TaxID=1010633 RepID=A0A835AQD9_9POAL|nr:hypothetical protein HU200_057081 [Digitaria exilis]